MATQHSFHIDIQKFADKVGGRLEHAFQKTCLELDKGVVLSTPVDTGQARGGWNAGVNSVNLSETELDKTGQSTIAKNEAAISKATIGDVVYISNNVNHIEYLERGRHTDESGVERGSLQAPHGMVAKTIRRFPQIIQEAVTESKREIP